jgi:hypothetical protein
MIIPGGGGGEALLSGIPAVVAPVQGNLNGFLRAPGDAVAVGWVWSGHSSALQDQVGRCVTRDTWKSKYLETGVRESTEARDFAGYAASTSLRSGLLACLIRTRYG